PTMLSERQERIAEAEAEIDGLLACVLMLREMLKRHQRLLEVLDRLPVGRTRRGLGTGLTKVTQGLAPHLAPEGMVREAFSLFIQALRRKPFDGLDNLGVEGTPTLLEQAAIGHLLRERVLERVFEFRKQACLVEKLGGLQVGERAA